MEGELCVCQYRFYSTGRAREGSDTPSKEWWEWSACRRHLAALVGAGNKSLPRRQSRVHPVTWRELRRGSCGHPEEKLLLLVLHSHLRAVTLHGCSGIHHNHFLRRRG